MHACMQVRTHSEQGLGLRLSNVSNLDITHKHFSFPPIPQIPTLPVAFLLHIQLTALKGSQGEREPEEDEELG